MEEKKINGIKAWPQPKLVQNIHVIIGFSNFHWHFIQGFSKITVLLTSILKSSSQQATALPATGSNNSEVVSNNDRKSGKLVKSDFIKHVRRAEKPTFLTLDAR